MQLTAEAVHTPQARVCNVVLLGLTGAGKSTLGRRLADLLGMGFVDTDKRIEQVAKSSVRELFAKEQEEGFRKREEAVVQYLSSLMNHVLVLGSGAAQFYFNNSVLSKKSLSVWVNPSITFIASRLLTNPEEIKARPLLESILHLPKDKQNEQLIQLCSELYEKRKDLYEKADMKFISVEPHLEIRARLLKKQIEQFKYGLEHAD